VSVVYGYFGQNSPSINAMICSSPAYSRKKKETSETRICCIEKVLELILVLTQNINYGSAEGQ